MTARKDEGVAAFKMRNARRLARQSRAAAMVTRHRPTAAHLHAGADIEDAVAVKNQRRLMSDHMPAMFGTGYAWDNEKGWIPVTGPGAIDQTPDINHKPKG